MFTMPAPPAPGHPGAPGSSLPSAPTFSPPALPTSNPKQLVVRTRSIGTNTQDGGVSGALEGDSACLGPCQPGTSVNLEGIVWHETEEGKNCCNFKMLVVPNCMSKLYFLWYSNTKRFLQTLNTMKVKGINFFFFWIFLWSYSLNILL